MHKHLFVLFSVISLFVIFCAQGYSSDSPQWRKQKQSALVIPQGGYVALQADGIDTSLLKAVLSTNETGSWRNETTTAFLWVQPAVYGFDNFGTATYRDGMLYAPSKGDNNVYAVNATNGDIVWNKTVRQCDASPCIDGDVIYVGECFDPTGETDTSSPRAMALNKTTGEEIWHFIEPNNYTWVGSPLVNGEYVYYTTYGSGIYALNKTNGNIIWHQDIGTVVCSVAYEEGVIFVSAYYPAGQYAFNATTGEEIWYKFYGQSWDTSPVIYDGMVIQVVGSSNAWTTYVLNKTTGKTIRKFEDEGCYSTPLVYDGKIVIPSGLRIWAFDLTTGKELWHTLQLHNETGPGPARGQSFCSPAAAGGSIYYQSLNGTFYVLNETDGGILWSYPLGGYGFGSPSIGDGCVFITNDAGLYAFKIGPGSGCWEMFCRNNFHSSFSEQGVEYVRWPLTQPQYLGEVSNTWVTAKFIWRNETITSAAIAWKIYFFDSEGNTNATDAKIFYINMSVHNIAIINVAPWETLIEQNQTTSINVTVANQGNYKETFNVRLFYDSTEIGFQALTLNASELWVLIFEWNTTGVSCANYTLRAFASIIPEEVDTQDNIYILEYPVAVVPEFPFAFALLTALIISTVAATLLGKSKRVHGNQF